jgi:hypothetical protein
MLFHASLNIHQPLSFLGSVLVRERYEGAESGVQGAAPAGDGQAGGGRVPARETGHRLKGPSHENICLSLLSLCTAPVVLRIS